MRQERRPSIAPCAGGIDDLLECGRVAVSFQRYGRISTNHTPQGKCTLKHDAVKRNYNLILTRPKILSASSKSLRRIATWLSSADRFISRPNCLCIDCMMCQLSPSVEGKRGGGEREKCGDWDRQAGNLLARKERRSLVKKEIQGQGKGLKMAAESGEV